MAVPTVTSQPFCRDAASLALALGADASVAGADVLASGDAVGDPEAVLWASVEISSSETAGRESSLSKEERRVRRIALYITIPIRSVMFTARNVPSLFEVCAICRCAPVRAKGAFKTFLIIHRGNAVLSYPLLPRDTRDESFHLVFTGVSEVVRFSIAANVKDDFGSIRQNRIAGNWG